MPVKPIPESYPRVCPYLMVPDAPRFVDFMIKVFGAAVGEQFRRPDEKLGHTELRLGDSMVMLSEACEPHAPTPVMLHVYVEDVDAAYARALEAGATPVQPVSNQFYGDRSGGVKEPCGNTIWIATHLEDVSPEEMKQRAAAAMKG